MHQENAKIEISCIIPVYNEENGIAGVIEGLHKILKENTEKYELIVVDDGSSDKTAEIAEKCDALVIKHPINRGYGRTLLSGFAVAKYDYVLLIDGDASYPPEEAQNLIKQMAGFDMVIGMRHGNLFWGSPFKALLRFIYLSMARFVAGEAIPDVNSGLRLIKKSAYEASMPFFCLGYSFTTTLTLAFLRSGRFVKYIPIKYIERSGVSKVHYFRDILRTMQIMIQTIIYYNPLKLVAVIFLSTFAGSLMLFAWLVLINKLAAAICIFYIVFILSINLFLLGCILDSLRLHNQDKAKF